MIARRTLLAGSTGLILSGCDRIAASPTGRGLLTATAALHENLQRTLIPAKALAPEYTWREMSPDFRTNGNTDAASNPVWAAHAAQNFSQWALQITGLVRRPLALPLTALKTLPQRTQITRHDCVEGWSAIGQWQGPPLASVLALAGVLPQARYVVFHCADSFDTTPYYESIALADAFHPQTILAHSMNGAPLAIGHGAPLRLRVERQLGYKQAKYLMRIELVPALTGIYGGHGGYWEDTVGYQWFAGI